MRRCCGRALAGLQYEYPYAGGGQEILNRPLGALQRTWAEPWPGNTAEYRPGADDSSGPGDLEPGVHETPAYLNPISSYLWVYYSPMIRRYLSTYMGAQQCNAQLQVLALSSLPITATSNFPYYSATKTGAYSRCIMYASGYTLPVELCC